MKSVALFLCLGWAVSVCGAAFADELSMQDAFSVLDVVHAAVPYHEDLDINLAGEGSYAVAFWLPAHGHAAGTALLEKSGTKWSLIKLLSTGVHDAATLEAFGVPASEAKKLVADMQHPLK
ncbi:MAG: hypothetical protein JO241_04980 [Candidatus Eremiobacteraeota bacterium]|nr:hypothetical protein [Candidatus Eremiobacteraeota bacterium]